MLVYDRVIPHQSEATLWVLAFGAFIALIMAAALKIARSRLIDQSGRQIEKATQTVLMDRLLGMRLDLMQRSPSQLFSAMREFGSIREFFTVSAVGTLADIPFILIFLILVYSIGGPVVGVLIVGGHVDGAAQSATAQPRHAVHPTDAECISAKQSCVA